MEQFEIIGLDGGEIVIAPLPHQRRLDDHRDPVVGQERVEFGGHDRSVLDAIAGPHSCGA